MQCSLEHTGCLVGLKFIVGKSDSCPSVPLAPKADATSAGRQTRSANSKKQDGKGKAMKELLKQRAEKELKDKDMHKLSASQISAYAALGCQYEVANSDEETEDGI